MRRFLAVFRFEFFKYVRSKVYIGVTLFAVAALSFLPFVPSLISGAGTAGQAEDTRPVLVIIRGDAPGFEYIKGALPGYPLEAARDEDDMSARVLRDEARAGLVLDGALTFSMYVKSESILSTLEGDVRDALTAFYRMELLMEGGMSLEEAQAALRQRASGVIVELGKGFEQTFAYTYVLLMLLYFAIIFYGQTIASSVVAEKSSRAMELLITSASPASLMFGKILGTCCAALLQFSLIIAAPLVSLSHNAQSLAGIPFIAPLFNMPPYIMAAAAAAFLLGFLLYAFMFGALGSLVSRNEELNTASLPVNLLCIAAFMLSISGIYNPGGGLMLILSFVPFTSPLAMFLRICMTDVPPLEIALSASLLAAAIAFIGVLAARIYRVGVLLYGKPPGLGTLLALIRAK